MGRHVDAQSNTDSEYVKAVYKYKDNARHQLLNSEHTYTLQLSFCFIQITAWATSSKRVKLGHGFNRIGSFVCFLSDLNKRDACPFSMDSLIRYTQRKVLSCVSSRYSGMVKTAQGTQTIEQCEAFQLGTMEERLRSVNFNIKMFISQLGCGPVREEMAKGNV